MDNLESGGGKRKRSISSSMPHQPRQQAQYLTSSNVSQINYLVNPRSEKLSLIEGDVDEFNDILGLIDEYDEVLQRHESLAANLGAKLVGPLLLKSLEKLFEGPIKVTAPYPHEVVAVTWLDVLEFARLHPHDFTLNTLANGSRVCHFALRQCNVEISEDDYRLVLSGAPERMIPNQPIPEDEVAELGTLDILEQRLSMLIKRADLIAARARQLNHHLKGRKSAITGRRSTTRGPEQESTSSPGAFMPVNSPPTISMSNGDSRTIHLDLLRQFVSGHQKVTPSQVKIGQNHLEATRTSTPSGSPLSNGRHTSAPTAAHGTDDGTGGQYRPLITARIEKLTRGEAIWPPCDRCRRLRMDCIKYLTACGGCTKKHAKCTWRDVSAEEASYLVQMPGSLGENAGDAQLSSVSDVSLDPVLRSTAEDGVLMAKRNSEGLMARADTKGPDNLSEEHAILTRMASAADAQGQR